jgi:hypothetical protein
MLPVRIFRNFSTESGDDDDVWDSAKSDGLFQPLKSFILFAILLIYNEV